MALILFSNRRLCLIAIMSFICLLLFLPTLSFAEILPDTPYDADLSGRVITLDPVGNHTPGDALLLTGTTTLPAGRKLAVSCSLPECRVGSCIRSEHYGYTVVVNESPGLNTWSYPLNTTGFWTTDRDGDRWLYDIRVMDDQFVTVNAHETMYLFNPTESVPGPKNPGLVSTGTPGLPQTSPVTTPTGNATAGQPAPVHILVPVAALGITGMIFLVKRCT